MPALLTVTDTFQEPRPFSAKALMRRSTPGRSWSWRRKWRRPCRRRTRRPGGGGGQAGAALEAKKLLIGQWTLDDIKADLAWCGRDGSPTKVKRIQSVVLKGSGYAEFKNNEADITKLVHQLIDDHTIG